MSERPSPVARMAPSAWNIANGLTILRLLLVPVFGWLLLWGDGQDAATRWWAFGVFAIAMVTDRIDGDIARSRGLITDFGKVADPIADKALVTMALVGLSMIGEIPWWITVVIIVREWGITAMRFWVIRHGVMAAGRGGKVKTLLQALALGFFVIPRFSLPLSGALDAVAWVTLVAALVVTVVTGVDYAVDAFRLRRTSPRALAKKAARAAARDDSPRPVSRAESLVATLVERGLTVATAESLTGGLVCAALTSVAGSSRTVRGGVVSYATDLKADLLGVDPERLHEVGPVDARVAEEMALGAARLLGADIGLSTTGVAGPGPADGMPAGTVFVAAAGPWPGGVRSRRLALAGDRAAVRHATVDAVLDLLDELLRG